MFLLCQAGQNVFCTCSKKLNSQRETRTTDRFECQLSGTDNDPAVELMRFAKAETLVYNAVWCKVDEINCSPVWMIKCETEEEMT